MAMQMTVEVESSEEGLNRARHLLQNGRFVDASATCRDILNQEPDHRDALYTLAVAERLSKDAPAALGTLEHLIGSNPSYGRAWQERGHCLRDLGRTEEAFAAYQSAITHNGALAASWRMLAQLHRAAGRDAQAGFAESQFTYLSSLPPELQTVASYIQEGRIVKAEQVCRAFLQREFF